MKLEQLDLIKTSCKECVFAEYTDNTQHGCHANMLDYYKNKDRLIEAYDDHKEFYVIKGFCQFYRPQGWNKNIPNLDLAKNEMSPTFSLIINCNELTIETQKQIVALLKDINYNAKNINIYLFYDTKQSKDTRTLALEILAIFQPTFNTSMSVCVDANKHIDELLFNKIKTMYFCILDTNNINMNFKNTFSDINNMIVNENKKNLLINAFNQTILAYGLYQYIQITDETKNFNQILVRAIDLSRTHGSSVDLS